MQYARRTDGFLEYMYGVQAKEPFGSVLSGSYNTYLGQQSELWIVNRSEAARVANITLTNEDGTPVVQGMEKRVPAHGAMVLLLNTVQGVEQYGLVTVMGDAPRSFSAWVIRRKPHEFAVATALRE